MKKNLRNISKKKLWKKVNLCLRMAVTSAIVKRKNVKGMASVLNVLNIIKIPEACRYHIAKDLNRNCLEKDPVKIINEFQRIRCKENKMDRIVLVTSPQAAGFYTKPGTVQIGKIESLVRK